MSFSTASFSFNKKINKIKNLKLEKIKIKTFYFGPFIGHITCFEPDVKRLVCDSIGFN